MRMGSNSMWVEPLGKRALSNTVQGIPNERKKDKEVEVVYYPNNRPWTWRPLHRAYRQRNEVRQKEMKMAEVKRTEAILRNLAQELLTEAEAYQFKQALHHFRVSHSVTSLCQQLKPIINTTQKILLLVELSTRMPKNLQEDFHRLCGLQYPSYDTYLKIFTSGNASNEIPRVIAQDSSGKFKIVSRGSEKKVMVKYNNQKHAYELHSQPGTSVTSGIYSNASDSEGEDYDTTVHNNTQGRITPIHLKGKKDVHRMFLNRHEDGSLGLGITGGKEYGTPIIINVVEEEGPAATMGLQVGDKILEVNGHTFDDITHAEAVIIMRNAWNLIILVERPLEADNALDEIDHLKTRHQLQELELIVYPANNGRLGCVTQRLRNQLLLVKAVEDNSPAAKAGVQARDQITKVDNISVSELSEKQIVMLTHAKTIILLVVRDTTLFNGDDTDMILRNGNDSNGTDSGMNSMETPPEKQRRINNRSKSEPRRRRDHSAESNRSSHHSNQQFIHNQENNKQRSPFVTRRVIDEPEHLVYGTKKSIRDGNWVLSPKPREHRYTQRKENLTRDQVHSYPIHGRSVSEGRNETQGHNGHTARDSGIHAGGVSRYVRNRAYSPHRNGTAVSKIRHEDNVIRAIQMGLEKRQRAIRLSLYQMPDPVDYEWEI